MKSTVVQIKGKYAVLLQEDGSFIKMKTMNLRIGDVVNMKEKNVCLKSKFGSMVSAALFAVLIGGGVYTYGAPSYYVSLDVNPGITMEVNRFERVIGLEAANVDAEEVLEGLELENKDIEEAVSQVVERISDLGYLDKDGGDILIAATAKNRKNAEKAAEKLANTVNEEIAEEDMDVEVTSVVVGYEMVEAARLIQGMTPGKYNLIVNLLKVAPEDAADYKETSIRNIMKMVIESKGFDGKKELKDASENAQNKEEEKVPVYKDFKGKDASKLPVEAILKEKNAPIDTPASFEKAPDAEAMENNSDKRSENSTNLDKPASEKKIEASEKPEIIEKPEIPEIDLRKERPESSSDPDADADADTDLDTDSDADPDKEKEQEAEETESQDQDGQSDDRRPETPEGKRQ